MVYLCVLGEANIYRYAIYLAILFILLLIDNTYLKKKLKNCYVIEILELSMILTMYAGERVYVATVILTLLTVAIERIEKTILRKKDSSYYILPFGFYLICSNIISFILINFTNV